MCGQDNESKIETLSLTTVRLERVGKDSISMCGRRLTVLIILFKRANLTQVTSKIMSWGQEKNLPRVKPFRGKIKVDNNGGCGVMECGDVGWARYS